MLRSSSKILLSRLVRSAPVYRTPVVFRWVFVCLALLGLAAYPLSRLQRPEIVLSAFECTVEALAAWSVWREARWARGNDRITLLVILAGICALLVADASFGISFYVLGREMGDEPLVVLLAKLPYAIAFVCFSAAPVIFAGRRFFSLAAPVHLFLGALLLTPLWLRFAYFDATTIAQDLSLGLVELSTNTAELVAALISIALVLNAITTHFALFYAGVLSLALADWVMKADERLGQIPEHWPLELFWAAAIVVTCMTMFGDARLPDLQKRVEVRSSAPRTRQTVVVTGLLVAAVIAMALLVVMRGVPNVAVHAGTLASITMTFMGVLAVLATLIAGVRHPADTEGVMRSETSALTRASVVIITTNSRHTFRKTASVFGVDREPVARVRGREYYKRDSVVGPIVLTRAPRIPNEDSLARFVAAVADWQPRLVIIIGAARSLRRELQIGDVILATEMVELVEAPRDDASHARTLRSVAIKRPLLEAVVSAPPWTPSTSLGFTRPALFHRGRVACERTRVLSPQEDHDLRREGVLAVELSGFGFGELAAKQLERTPTLMMCGVFPDAVDWSWEPSPPEVESLGGAVSYYLKGRLGDLVEAADAVHEPPTDDPLAHASIFVSHRSGDGWFARELAQRLFEHGATVLFDDEHLGPNSATRDRIGSVLKRSSHIVVVASGSMEGHPWFDMREHVAPGKVICPILLDRQARSWVTMYFSGVASFDFSTPAFVALEHSFAHLISVLRAKRWKPGGGRGSYPREHSLTRDLDALITGFSEVLDRWMAGRIHVDFIMWVLEAELDRLVPAELREGVDFRLGTLEKLLIVSEGEREAKYGAVIKELEDLFAYIRAVKKNTMEPRRAVLERLARELADELATVAYDSDRAKMIAVRAGFPPGHLPEFKTATRFWNGVTEQARHGVCGLDALAGEAREQFPHNEQLRKLGDAIDQALARTSAW